MRHIVEFNEYFVNLEIDPVLKKKIRDWVRKYEKVSNIHTDEFPPSIEDTVSDVMKRFKINSDKRDGVREYLRDLYDLSDGISVVLTPEPELNYTNNPDQVQTLYF